MRVHRIGCLLLGALPLAWLTACPPLSICQNEECHSDGEKDGPSGTLVYVSGRAPSGGDGSKAKPFATIGAALARSTHIAVCEGNYRENVVIAAGVELTGGFDCTAWNTTGASVKVSPASGIPLTVTANNVAISGISFKAPDGTAASTSSVAALVVNANNVTFIGVSFTAGTGARGSDGTLTPVTNPATPTLNGNASDGGVGGKEKVCSCPAGGTSTAGAGGNFNHAGGPGSASPATGRDGGAGGPPNDSCATGMGGNGSNAPDGANGTSAQVWGSIDATKGWSPTAGTSGQAGGPGQGGGGGGGPTIGASGAGGGGGCGACGGAGASGGTGGGGSIALLMLASDVTLTSCTLTAGHAGDGGNAVAGQPGQSPGGAGGFPDSNGGCQGGRGGNGGRGGAGAGGAGGVSAGVLWQGQAPKADTTKNTITASPKGTRGIGGTAPDCASPASNCGVDGVSGAIVELRVP